MKNLKKVLAMVLAFACTFSMFAGAKVFEDVPAGSDYSEAITMLSDLGIIQGKDDGKYHPEDTITRAEACAMIARLMTGDPNVSQYVGAQSFTDVAKGSWKDSAIGYCYINGIVIGVGDNKFEPDRAITDAEFITMVVRAMGYETADMKQNYPYSYMSNAQAIGLLDGTNMVASTDALRGEDAQVIYNALFADYARGAKLVNTTHGTSVEQYPTLAESVWGLDRAAVGTWNKDSKDDETATLTNCKAHTWVVVGADKDNEGNILAYPIDDDTTDIYESDVAKVNGTQYVPYSFKYDGDVESIKGYQVELWGQGKHGDPTWEKGEGKFVYSDNWEIKAVKTVKGQTKYDYDASKADSKSDNGEIALDEETLKLESVADNAKQLAKANTTETGLTTYLSKDEYNGEKIGDKKNVEKALNVRNGAQYKLMDWDSDGDIDWVVVDQASYFKVESVNSKRLTVSAMKADSRLQSKAEDESKTWKLDDLNDEKDYKVKYEVPEDLEEGDVIELTYKVAYDKGEKCEVITATATKVEADTAELDKVSTKDDLELTFDGEVNKIAQNAAFGDVIDPANPDKYADFDDEELGTEFALWKNRNGFIVYSDYATETSNYMMVLDTGDGSDKTGDRSLATADILLSDNSVKKDVEFASDLKVKGYNKDNRHWDEKYVVGNVYKYWQDEDGVITKMEAVIAEENAVEDKNVTKDTDYSYDESADRLKDKDGKFVASLEEADVIFAVTENYIQGTENLKVDSGDVMAVKQSDIPDINVSDKDTQTATLNENNRTWLGDMRQEDNQMSYVASVDKNGEASAAILGVENFNKFNDAATKVGLVTSVSYDKNDVVEVEVAVDGEVTTLKSNEKVDFDDVVEQYSKKDNKDTGLTTKKAADLLKNNAAYAEITTNADGVLTNVTFMDVNNNKAVGHYYEVSRRIITDVKDSNVAYGDSTAYFYNDKNLYSVGRLDVTDTDTDKDIKYYTIDGRPTTHNDKYNNVKMSVANGFDGTPDITAESDSSLIESYVNDKFDDADTYQVADLARKIDGDIVAAFAFDGSLGEVDKTASIVDDLTVQAGKSGTIDVDAAAGQTMKLTGVSVKDNVAGIDVSVVDDDTIKVDVARTVPAGKYTVEYTYTIGGKNYNGSFELTVKKADEQKISDVEKGDVAASKTAVDVTVKDQNDAGVEDLTAADFTVELNGQVLQNTADKNTYTVYHRGNGVYQIALQNMDGTLEGKTLKVTVGGISVNFDSQLGSTDVTVDTTEEFENALADENVKKITLTDDVAVPAGLEIANENVVIDGNGQTITVDDKTRGKEAQFLISADGVTLKNVTVVSNSDFAIQVYKATGVTLEDVTAVGATGAVLVNGSEVTMKNCEVQNTGDKAWGGINVDKGQDVATAAELTIKGTLTFDKVAADKPVIWSENDAEATITVPESVNLEKQENAGDAKDQVWYIAK